MASSRPENTAASRIRWRFGVSASVCICRVLHIEIDMSSSTCRFCHMIVGVSLRYALLGMLAVQPGTGYELAQRFDSSMSNAWYASHSQIYPELAKLCEGGLLEVVGQGPRRSRTFGITEAGRRGGGAARGQGPRRSRPFGITEAGRRELRDWLVESEPNRSQRNETTIRWFLLELLPPEDRRAVIERELRDVTEYHQGLVGSAEALDALDYDHPFRPMVGLAVRSSQVMLDWLNEQLEATPK